MSLTGRVLIGLVLGLAGGIAISLIGDGGEGGALSYVPRILEPIGTLWVNAIRMTVVPLVVSLLIVAIAGNRKSGLVATLGGKTVGLFAVMIAAVSAFTAIVAPPLLALLPLDAATAASLRSATAVPAGTVELPPFRDWLVGLVPTNPLRAAVDGAMLPLIVFTGLFGFALTRIPAAGRDTLLGFFGAIKDAMFVLIEWILAAAPFGVFALMLPLAARMGASAAGALGYFVLIACALITVAMLALYPMAVALGRVSLAEFARALAPAQAVGFSTRSSLASLPTMYASTESLGIPARVSGLVLPVAVSVFKFASPIGRTAGTYFIARLYGIELGAAEIAAIAGAVGLLSFYSPGIPSGGLLIMTPIYVSFGLPVEGIGILIALDLIVDMFITMANVTANITVATVLARGERAGGPPRPSAGVGPAG